MLAHIAKGNTQALTAKLFSIDEITIKWKDKYEELIHNTRKKFKSKKLEKLKSRKNVARQINR